MDLNDAIRRGLTGARRDAPTTRSTLQDAMRAYGGTRGVAQQLGVSQRTVQRWLKGTHRPSGTNRQRVRGLERDPNVRAAVRPPRRSNRLRRQGARVVIDANQGPRGYERPRVIDFRMSGDAIERIEDLWYAGDEEGARQAFLDAITDDYANGEVDSWDIGFINSWRFE